MSLPTETQLNPFPADLDGKVVVDHLLGKSVHDAALLLQENSTYYQEDYLWMGPAAFCFYAPALVAYLRSAAADGDMEFAYGMLHTFRHRLEHERAHFDRAIPVIREFCSIMTNNFGRLGFDDNYKSRALRRIDEIEAVIGSTQPAGCRQRRDGVQVGNHKSLARRR